MGKRSRELRERRQSREAVVRFSAVDEVQEVPPRTAMSNAPKPRTDSAKAWSRSVCDCGALLPAHWRPTLYDCRCGTKYFSASWRTKLFKNRLSDQSVS